MTSQLLLATVVLATLLTLITFLPRWHRKQEKYDGELVVVGYDEITGNPDLQLIIKQDPIELIKKKTIRLKMVDETK